MSKSIHKGSVRYSVRSYEIPVNMFSQSEEPLLMLAVGLGLTEIVSMLLTNGVNTNLQKKV